MRDQAATLRNLIQRQTPSTDVVPDGNVLRARVMAFTSGKGGVGKSNLALNVAVELARLGARVCVLDANPGLGNIELLCGLTCYWNFSHVVTGAKSLQEVILKGPAGINVLPGASVLIDLAEAGDRIAPDVLRQIAACESAYDYWIVDAGSGMRDVSRRLAVAADQTYLVITPEPTAIADAYATFKAWHAELASCPELIVNRSASTQQARQILKRFADTTELFLKCAAPCGRPVAEDDAVAKSVAARQPFACLFPESSAARDVRVLAKQLFAGARAVRAEAFMHRLCRSGNL